VRLDDYSRATYRNCYCRSEHRARDLADEQVHLVARSGGDQTRPLLQRAVVHLRRVGAIDAHAAQFVRRAIIFGNVSRRDGFARLGGIRRQ